MNCVSICATAIVCAIFLPAGTHSHVVTSISHNECFKFNGGVLTKDGHKWYELQDVHGHHVGYVSLCYYTHGIKLGNTHFFRFVFHMDSNNRKVID